MTYLELYEKAIYELEHNKIALIGFNKMIEPLNQEIRQWIPCTPETMPEEKEWIGTKRFGTTISDKVLVTFERPDGSRFVKDLRFQNRKLSGIDQNSIDVFDKGSIPIMWMPWPEPYQEGVNK